jgi:hypothetical protein
MNVREKALAVLASGAVLASQVSAAGTSYFGATFSDDIAATLTDVVTILEGMAPVITALMPLLISIAVLIGVVSMIAGIVGFVVGILNFDKLMKMVKIRG